MIVKKGFFICVDFLQSLKLIVFVYHVLTYIFFLTTYLISTVLPTFLLCFKIFFAFFINMQVHTYLKTLTFIEIKAFIVVLVVSSTKNISANCIVLVINFFIPIFIC